jgi:hypothetical protein
MPSDPPVEIRESLPRFLADHPDAGKAAFIMMRFARTSAHKKITKAIEEALGQYGIAGLRADDKEYHADLLPNILTYLHGCGFGIAVFERIEADEFNPNVALEVGYMLSLGKHVCLLKDQTLRTLHTDLIGKLYRTFDPQNPAGTIPGQLTQWMQDKGIVSATTTP